MKLNFKAPGAAAIVAGAAFVASAGHIVHVVDETNPIGFALAYPIGIDGLIYVGIRAMQTKRVAAGALALLIGAAFSLAFNAHAEEAFDMPRLMIAASMPVCMFAAFLIEHFADAPEPVEIEAPAAAPVMVESEFDRMNERVETRLRAEHALQMETMKAEFEQKFNALQAPVRVEIERPAPVVRPAITSGTRGRVASWDVEKTVGLIMDGRKDEDVLATVDGLTAKPLQRTRRAVRLLTEDASTTDASLAETVGQSAGHIARVRAAMKG